MKKIDCELEYAIKKACTPAGVEYTGYDPVRGEYSAKYLEYPIYVWKFSKECIIFSTTLFSKKDLIYYRDFCGEPFDIYMNVQERMPEFSICIDNGDHIQFTCRTFSIQYIWLALSQMVDVVNTVRKVKKQLKN